MSARPPYVPLILGALAAATLGGCDRQASPPAQPSSAAAAPAGGANAAAGKIDSSHKGAAMPAFALTGPDGTKVSSKDLAGKPVLVNLWATWCGPCVVEMPTLDKLAAGGLRVLTVSQDSAGQADKVKGFKAEHGLAHVQMLLDPDNDLSFHYNTGVLPTTVVYDAQGKEVGRVVGAFDWTGPEAAALIKAAS
ncbi:MULTISPECIES: TlpA family protein disulfide reductase [unclassified Novosphingobium]|uniref:TlpA family protein disulfide reductase n=1 Tax=Novosphingobium TaxID=165696 RepID=UPI00185B7402|nr:MULTISPECIES: TlpA disulfide reductase family protein [unclassified Novosphingobium]NKJ42979.1 thiol-disulfide isomerase/thioredoxin [Novosphingobium sp. SG720]NMN07498.1 thiol-disulfide isomerase/thioredoxin [Novosphingobium sp. SG919]NMN89815.1 thiol-disulfide isomerase/thioredoxin [Novosphingobium sp. SG916]